MKNVGIPESRVRFVLGLLLFIVAYFAEGMPQWFILGAGVVLIVTAFLRFCPLWFGFRINTHAPKKAR